MVQASHVRSRIPSRVIVATEQAPFAIREAPHKYFDVRAIMSDSWKAFNLELYRARLGQMTDRELKKEGRTLLQRDRFEILDTVRLQVAEVRLELRRRHPSATKPPR